MIESVVIIGAVMTVVMILIGVLLLKASRAKYLPYYPGMVIFVSGIVLIVVATIAGKIEIFGAGLGGWGIAFLFSSAIGFIITSIVDSYTSPVTN